MWKFTKIQLKKFYKMKNNILDLVNSYWKFDNGQCPTSTWHDKQDLLREIEFELEKQLADVRNKFSPIKNLIALVETFNFNMQMENTKVGELFKNEIIKSKDVIKEICKI